MERGLLGRGRELGRLLELLSGLSESGPRCALIEGPRGAGKTHLVDSFLDAVSSRPGIVLSGRCRRGVPFGPIEAIFEQLLQAGVEQVGRDLPFAALRCDHGCHRLWLSHPSSDPFKNGHRRRALFSALRQGIVRLAERCPVVLVLRDYHLIDAETAALVASLLGVASDEHRIDPEAQLLIVVEGCRPESPSRSVKELRRHPRSVRFPLSALDEAGLRDLLQQPTVVARLLKATGGKPESIHRLVHSAPPSVETFVQDAYEELGPGGRKLLAVLAILSRPTPLEELARIADLAPEVAREAAPMVAGAGLVFAGASGWEFFDDEMRAAVLAGQEASTLAELRARAAAEAEAQGDFGGALRLAADAGDARACQRLGSRAARWHADRGAYAEGAELLAGTVSVMTKGSEERSWAQFELAQLYLRSGQFHKAVAPARAAYEQDRNRERAELFAKVLVQSGQRDAALRVIAGAIEDSLDPASSDPASSDPASSDQDPSRPASSDQDPARQGASLRATLAELRFQNGELEEARRLSEEVIAGNGEADARLRAFQTRAKVSLAEGALADALQHYETYHRAAELLAHPDHAALAIGGMGVAHLTRGDTDAAERSLRRCAELSEARGDRKGMALAALNLGVVAHLRHDYVRAREGYEEAMVALQLVGNRTSLARCAFNLGELYLTLGDSSRALRMCRFGLQAGGAELSPRATADGLLLRGRVKLEQGDALAARTAFGAALGIFERTDPVRGVAARAGLVRVALALGEEPVARSLLTAAIPSDLPPLRASEWALAEGEVLAATGSSEVALEAYERAQECAKVARDDEFHLEALIRLASLRYARGELGASSEMLTRARKLDAQMGGRVPSDLRPFWDDRRLRRSLLALHGTERRRDGQRSATRSGLDGGIVGIVGESPAMKGLLTKLRRVGPSDCTVLVLGESGTGKELLSRALHRLSPRSEGPLVCVNCGAIVETLLLSELFGHERGAFTGAHARKRGRFEMAHGGTLFLDEVAEISPRVQAALLRVLQERTFERVGGHEPISVDVRVVAATNRNLEQMVAAGEFREDLYYRLREVSLFAPPLRSRPEDIAPIALHVLGRLGRERGEAPKRLSAAALAEVQRYHWPGNVRELENCLRAATLFVDGAAIEPEHLELRRHSGPPGPAEHRPAGGAEGDAELYYHRLRGGELSLRDLKKEIERDCIARALSDAAGNISRAATLLGMKRPRLSQLVKEYGLRPGGDRT
ncbi:MAG: sigma 54-interacting transcriptional regulator [Myxococcota bacterium]